MKSEVYSWRVPSEIKSQLERESRLRKMPVSAILEAALGDWLNNNTRQADDEEHQRRLHAEAEVCLGVLAGRNPRRAETARETIRKRLANHRAR